MNIEIELRYEIIDESSLSKFLAPLPLLSKKRIVDIYLDTPTAELIERGIYIRLRNNHKLDIKFNRACLDDPTLEMQAYCEEYSFEIPLVAEELTLFNKINDDLGLKKASTLEEYKALNSLSDHRTVDKTRTTYSIADFSLAIDEVQDLGTFLELELLSNSIDAIDSVTNQMKDLLSTLQLKPLRTGYDSLILRKHNFPHYLKGRFALPEDKMRFEPSEGV